MAISSRPPAIRPPARPSRPAPAPSPGPAQRPSPPSRPRTGLTARLLAGLQRLYGPASHQPFQRVGFDSAARIFATMVAALGLAALINADAMVQRAEDKPFGPERDRSLAIWHPVQDVAHVLQLHRIRRLGDALVGDEDGGSAAPAPVEPVPTTPTVTVPPRPEVRLPTAADPLRVWVGGDSMMRDLSVSVERLAADDPLLDVATHYEISSGLSRPDYYDWPAALDADMASTDAEIVILMLGANDGQGLVAADGTVHQRVSEPGWQREYARRVADVMDRLRAGDRLVLWVAQPPMRDGDFHARMAIINGITRDAAATRPWVEYVDTAPMFGDADGAFADRLPGPGGELLDLRQGDGIHLAREGADLLGAHLLDLVAAEAGTAPG